jgi:hypothetical protein
VLFGKTGADLHRLRIVNRRATMPTIVHADDLTEVVRYALETTRATMVCPFHRKVVIRVGDDAAESHAIERAKRIVRSDGSAWQTSSLREEFSRQLAAAADRCCPRCVRPFS